MCGFGVGGGVLGRGGVRDPKKLYGFIFPVLCMLSSLRRCSSSALSSGRVGTIQEVRDSLVRASGMTEKWNASEPHRNVKVLDPIKDRSLLIPQPVSQST